MDLQFGSNTTTYYVILPLLIILAALIIWLVVKIKVSVGKKVALSFMGLLAFLGFAMITLWVYYLVDDSFAGTFKFYAYSALAPGEDPFLQSDGYNSQVLAMTEVYVKDGNVRIPESLSFQEEDYGWYLFLPGRWMTAGQIDRVLIPREEGPYFSGPSVVETSLWWALTKDIYTGVSDASSSNVNTDTTPINTTAAISSGDTVVSPAGKYMIFVENSYVEPYRTLKRRDLQTNKERVLATTNFQYKYYDFTWYGNNRVYYAEYGKINGDGSTALYYHDFSGADPSAVTTIVFEDPDLIMQGEVGIAGVGEDILYIQKDNKIYSINLKEGAGAIPELVVNMENI